MSEEGLKKRRDWAVVLLSPLGITSVVENLRELIFSRFPESEISSRAENASVNSFVNARSYFGVKPDIVV